jgi:hypothetical protein
MSEPYLVLYAEIFALFVLVVALLVGVLNMRDEP